MGARSYDPALGSFATQDPVLGHLGIGVSENRYPYVLDNHVNGYDLNGRDACVPTPLGAIRQSGVENAAQSAWEHLNPYGNMPTAPEDLEYLASRAPEFVKSPAVRWFEARGDEAVRTFECIAERVVQRPGPVGCQEAAEQFKPEPAAPEEEPRLPPPGVPGKDPVPVPGG